MRIIHIIFAGAQYLTIFYLVLLIGSGKKTKKEKFPRARGRLLGVSIYSTTTTSTTSYLTNIT